MKTPPPFDFTESPDVLFSPILGKPNVGFVEFSGSSDYIIFKRQILTSTGSVLLGFEIFIMLSEGVFMLFEL